MNKEELYNFYKEQMNICAKIGADLDSASYSIHTTEEFIVAIGEIYRLFAITDFFKDRNLARDYALVDSMGSVLDKIRHELHKRYGIDIIKLKCITKDGVEPEYTIKAGDDIVY